MDTEPTDSRQTNTLDTSTKYDFRRDKQEGAVLLPLVVKGLMEEEEGWGERERKRERGGGAEREARRMAGGESRREGQSG